MELLFALVLVGFGVFVGRKSKDGPGLIGPTPKTLQTESESIDDKAIAANIANAEQASAANRARAENVLTEAEAAAKAEGRTTRREGNNVIPSAVDESPEASAKRFREWAAKNMAKQGGG